jgi:hypothetical protein
LTDLIFNGSRYSYSLSDSFANPLSLAILSFGNDSFYVRDLSLDHFEDIAAHPIRLDGKPYIQTIRVTQSHIGAEYHMLASKNLHQQNRCRLFDFGTFTVHFWYPAQLLLAIAL